ncbi:MAG: type II secretion system protein [Patescibacteria group bacterium]
MKKLSVLIRQLTDQFSTRKGFTLIELLIVITIIATLAVTVFVALNPAQRIKDAKDARRTSDIDSILTAIHQAIVDNKGSVPSNLPANPGAGNPPNERQLGTGDATVAAGCGTAIATNGCNTPTLTACADLMTGTINVSKYLKTMPIDPSGGTTYTAVKTGYSVARDANDIITITACNKEGTGANIQASR